MFDIHNHVKKKKERKQSNTYKPQLKSERLCVHMLHYQEECPPHFIRQLKREREREIRFIFTPVEHDSGGGFGLCPITVSCSTETLATRNKMFNCLNLFIICSLFANSECSVKLKNIFGTKGL